VPLSNPLDPELLKRYVEVQAQTKCRKCKATDWELTAKRSVSHGGDRVGIFVVLGGRDEEVQTIAFACKACGAAFERPAYSRAQLAAQEFPAIQLDVRTEDRPGGNGTRG
jgi:hypothetical protein